MIDEDINCKDCDGEGTVCLACDSPITDCECGEDSEPCPCEPCKGTGCAALAEAKP